MGGERPDRARSRWREGDLEIGGTPIATAEPDLVEAASSILTERRLALSWLRGHQAVYSAGDTST